MAETEPKHDMQQADLLDESTTYIAIVTKDVRSHGRCFLTLLDLPSDDKVVSDCLQDRDNDDKWHQLSYLYAAGKNKINSSDNKRRQIRR